MIFLWLNFGNYSCRRPVIIIVARQFIKFFEGFRTKPYICSGGYNTIGFGHKILAHEKFDYISRSKAESLLRSDLLCAEKSVLRNITSVLSDDQFAALVSFTFNMGGSALQRSTMRQKINYGQHKDAGLEFLRWVYAGGKILPGLVSPTLKTNLPA